MKDKKKERKMNQGISTLVCVSQKRVNVRKHSVNLAPYLLCVHVYSRPCD